MERSQNLLNFVNLLKMESQRSEKKLELIRNLRLHIAELEILAHLSTDMGSTEGLFYADTADKLAQQHNKILKQYIKMFPECQLPLL